MYKIKNGIAVLISGVVLSVVLLFIGLKTPIYHFKAITVTPVITQVPTATPSATLTPSQVVLGPCHAIPVNANDPQAYLPDTYCTPGATTSAVTQFNIQQTICKLGYTGTIRPPVDYTNALKRVQMAEYGFSGSLSNFEEDHLISLELGGSPTDPKNLWPEPGTSPNEKDKVERYLNKQVCEGIVSLQQAQKRISTNWYSIYKQMK